MDTLGILFVALVFLVIAIGAVRGKAAKPEHFVEDDPGTDPANAGIDPVATAIYGDPFDR